MIVSAVLPEHIADIWHLVADYLDGAARYTYGRFTVSDIKEGLLTKPQQLWIAYESDGSVYGAVVTEVMEYPQMTALVMHFTGGIKLPKWKNEMLELLQRFAKDNGCKIIESYGRRGWGKVFKNDGFKERFMFYEIPINE